MSRGISIAKKKNHNGSIARWQEGLFKIAKQENKVLEMRKWAEILFFNGFSNMQWYQSLKSTYPEDEWADKCEEIIAKLKDKYGTRSNRFVNTAAKIYLEENYTDRFAETHSAEHP